MKRTHVLRAGDQNRMSAPRVGRAFSVGSRTNRLLGTRAFKMPDKRQWLWALLNRVTVAPDDGDLNVDAGATAEGAVH